ncbi:MAG: sodium:alanine symporter family protein, partial [Planctomycetales bacterium]|nr:sodium:alanine symporter family protein [Planctomycetales bacterium]
MSSVDTWFGEYLVTPIFKVLFYDLRQLVADVEDEAPAAGATPLEIARARNKGLPAVVVWLAIGATFLTLRMGFINLRAFWHAVRVTKGDYDNASDEGEVTHFQALSSALSATVGLGNIGSVAVAVGLGGPGAVF